MRDWQSIRARALRVLREFDPNEPRDDQGRWTGDGGDGGGDHDGWPAGGHPHELARINAGDKVDGLTVLEEVPNTSSIDSSMEEHDSLGLREVPFSIFEGAGNPTRSERNKDLAEQIKASGEISPLIVAFEEHNKAAGPYIVEGSHRFDALQILGKKSFPALVVVDTSGAPAPAPSGSYKQPTKEQIETWDKQIGAAQTALGPEGLGGKEDTELQRMSGAIGMFARATPEDIESGKVGINVIYDDEKLYAAVATQFDDKKKVAEITFAGGIDRYNRAAALRGAADRNEELGAKRVEGHEFNDDTEAIETYKDAGFRQVGEGTAGVVTMIRGLATTPEEAQQIVDSEKAHVDMVRGMSSSVAKDLDFDPTKILLGKPGDPYQDFVLNGKQYKAAGVAFTRAEHGNKGSIKLWPSQIWGEKDAERITAHEIEHIKFQNALDRYKQERDAVMLEPGPPPKPDAEHHWDRVGGLDAVMKPDGTLRAPYDEKYPAYHLIEQATLPGSEKFANGDGVTNYSTEYWKQWEANKTAVNFQSAQHETLAEMAALKYTTGKFPEHKGDTQKVKDEHAKIWRNLYRAVDKIHGLPK